ncbi:DNA replication initiation factor cdc45 [Microbotryomycetes sp. JL221]|nr:DNA replication initiation factor cdc45 [Microbotryomycetes sp. JL221]
MSAIERRLVFLSRKQMQRNASVVAVVAVASYRMHIPASLYPTAYHSIVSRARGASSATTFVLVSPDVDALCAARLLTNLLKNDDVVNTLIPVASWSELEQLRTRLEREEVRSLILINLGALVDLQDYFDYLPSTCLIHVIDSHRPINLRNLFEPAQYGQALFDQSRIKSRGPLPVEQRTVVVWSDSESANANTDADKEAWQALQYEPESDSDSDSDSEDELPVSGRRDDDDDSDDSELGQEGTRKGKRRRTSQEPIPLTKAQRRRYRMRIDKYYTSGNFSGQSVAGQVFALAVLLERADTNAVWLAIVGLTCQFCTNVIDRDRYEGYVELLADEVARLSSTTTSLITTSDPLASTGPNDQSVRPTNELRFCLFRHWNLYDAMYHSGYLVSKMKLWTERGRKNLSGMLAKMGCPLSESSETYENMATDLKLSLFGKIEQLAPEYGLHDLVIPSFVRKSGYKTDISASDAVEGLGALLEVATGVRLDFGNAVAWRRGPGGVGTLESAREHGGREEWSEGIKSWVAKGTESKEIRRPFADQVNLNNNIDDNDKETMDESETEIVKNAKREREWALRNFWLAWDALSADTTLLRSALPLSMALHRAVMDQGGYILEKQAIKTLRTYRLAVIKEGPDLTVFRHPSTLIRLANWLVDAVRDIVHQTTGTQALPGKRAKSLPFVLASLNETNDAFLVVGVVGAIEYGDVKKNAFGVAFQRAAVLSGARTRHNSFEASVIEVRRDDLDKFLKDLAMS